MTSAKDIRILAALDQLGEAPAYETSRRAAPTPTEET